MLCGIIIRKHNKIHFLTVSSVVSHNWSFNKIFLMGSHFFLILILIYFLHKPLHELAFYRLKYPLRLFPSYLNLAFVYFNQICAIIYLMYPSSTSLRIHKLKLLYKLTTEHTVHSRVQLFITQTWIIPKIVESQSKLTYSSSIEV